MLSFNEVRIFIENERIKQKYFGDRFKIIKKENRDDLFIAYEKRDLPAFIELLWRWGPNQYERESEYDHVSIFIIALFDNAMEFVYALLLFNVDLRAIILESSLIARRARNWQSQEQYYHTRDLPYLQVIFELAVFGCELQEKDFFELFVGIPDFTNFNFIGFSYQGHPLTPQILLENNVSYNGGGIFTEEDVHNLLDEERKNHLQHCIGIATLKYGQHRVNGYYNVVPLQRATEMGDEETFKVRMKAGGHLDTEDDHPCESLINAMKGAVIADSALMADFIIKDFIYLLINHNDYGSYQDSIKIAVFIAEHEAIENHKNNILPFLQAYIMDLQLDSLPATKVQYGLTRLHFAALRGDLALAEKLLALDSRMREAMNPWRVSFYKEKPLTVAAQRLDNGAMLVLLLKKSETSYTLEDLIQTLEAAVRINNQSAILCLLQHDARIFTENPNFLPVLISSDIPTQAIIQLIELYFSYVDFKNFTLLSIWLKKAKFDGLDSEKQTQEINLLLELIPFFIQNNFYITHNIENFTKRIVNQFRSIYYEEKYAEDYREMIYFLMENQLLDAQFLLKEGLMINDELTMQLALDLGADINYQDEEGNTLLHYAAKWNTDEKYIDFLYERGANPKLVNYNDQLPSALIELNQYRNRNPFAAPNNFYIFRKTSYFVELEKTYQRDFSLRIILKVWHSKNREITPDILSLIKILCAQYGSDQKVGRLVKEILLKRELSWVSAFASNGFNFLGSCFSKKEERYMHKPKFTKFIYESMKKTNSMEEKCDFMTAVSAPFSESLETFAKRNNYIDNALMINDFLALLKDTFENQTQVLLGNFGLNALFVATLGNKLIKQYERAAHIDENILEKIKLNQLGAFNRFSGHRFFDANIFSVIKELITIESDLIHSPDIMTHTLR